MATIPKIHPITKEFIPPKKCVGVLHRGPYNQIGPAFHKLYDQLKSVGGPPACGPGAEGGKTLGLFLDDPHTTKAEDLRSYAAIDITSSSSSSPPWWPSDWETIEVGGGQAAVMTVIGGYDQLAAAWPSFVQRLKEELQWKGSDKPEYVSQEMYVEMDQNDPTKNVTKLIMFLEDE